MAINFDIEQIDRKVFAALLIKDWKAILEQASLKSYKAGEVVMRQGWAPDGLYIIKSGQLRVERQVGERPLLLAQRGPGELLGEMSVLENVPVMATVTADVDSEVYFVQSMHMVELLGEIPGFATRYYRSLAIQLSGRLRQASEKIEELHNKLGDQVVPFSVFGVGDWLR